MREDCLSRRLQGKRQRFPGHSRHERANHPAESRGDVARERNDFALHVYAVVPIFQAPPCLHSPKKSAVGSARFFALISLAGIFHFPDVRGTAAAVRARRGVASVNNVVFGIQHHGDHLLAAKSQKNAIVMVVTGLDSRAFNIRGVVFRVMIVIFEDAQHVIETRTGDKNQALPVMNHAARARDFVAGTLSAALFQFHAALCQIRVSPFAFRLGEFVDPQQTGAALQFGIVTCLRSSHVVQKRFGRASIRDHRFGCGNQHGRLKQYHKQKQSERLQAMGRNCPVSTPHVSRQNGSFLSWNRAKSAASP